MYVYIYIYIYAHLFLQVTYEEVQDEGLALSEGPSYRHHRHILAAYVVIVQYAIQGFAI